MAKVNWSEAYRRQAVSDYEVLIILESVKVPYCHKLRYMQMCTEKLAKCFLSVLSGKERQPNTHERLVKFVLATRYYPKLYQYMNFKKKDAYWNYLDAWILPVAKALEDHYPSGKDDRPNTEYPWEMGDNVIIPSEYKFPGLSETNRKVVAFWNYIRSCFRFFSNQTY